VEHLLPTGMDVKVASIERLDDYEQSLKVTFDVKGAIGSSTGKRLLITSDIFETNSKATFPHEKREIPIYFQYPTWCRMRSGSTSPQASPLSRSPPARSSSSRTSPSIRWRLNPLHQCHRPPQLYLGEIIFKAEEYPGLRSFYGKNGDQGPGERRAHGCSRGVCQINNRKQLASMSLPPSVLGSGQTADLHGLIRVVADELRSCVPFQHTQLTPNGFSAAIRRESVSILSPACAVCPVDHAGVNAGVIEASPPSFE